MAARGQRVVLVACVAVLALPAQALAHGRTATVALDYRLRLDASALAIPGVHVRVLDGDRALRLGVDGGHRVVVKGYLDEELIRIGPDGVSVNADSPTADLNKLVSASAKGWVNVSSGQTFRWHDHRLAPPQTASGRFAIPITVDGRAVVVGGMFLRIDPPSLWPWLLGGVAVVGAIFAATRRRTFRGPLTIGLGVAAGLAALAAETAFSLRDAPNGRVAWVSIGAGFGVALALAALLFRLHGPRRVHAAGIVGAIAAAASIGSLTVFWHGVVISALPATSARLACGFALVGGAAAGVLSFLSDFDTAKRAPR